MIISTSTYNKVLKANRQLPLFMIPKYKYHVGVVMYSFCIMLYLTSNHIHVFSPQYLPMSWVDSMIPFLPYTVWIYLSEYIFFVAVYVTCKDMVNLNKYFYSYLGLYAISISIFWIWPTTYPRELFPLPTSLNDLTYFAFKTLRETDTPANCCPSLHVSSVYLSSFLFLDEQREKFPFFFLWATAIALTTLTTKQHYIIDVIIGFSMAVAYYWIFHRYVSYRPSGSTFLGITQNNRNIAQMKKTVKPQ